MQEILLLLYANNFLNLANYIALGILLLFVCRDRHLRLYRQSHPFELQLTKQNSFLCVKER